MDIVAKKAVLLLFEQKKKHEIVLKTDISKFKCSLSVE